MIASPLRGSSKGRSTVKPSSLHREGSCPDPAARRHRHHRQYRLTRGQRRASRHPCRRRPAFLPAEILADLKPIEQLFAKLKHWLRKAAQRTTEAVYDAIAPIPTPSHPPNAPITSPTPDIIKPKLITL
jgi:hypothetical protein